MHSSVLLNKADALEKRDEDVYRYFQTFWYPPWLLYTEIFLRRYLQPQMMFWMCWNKCFEWVLMIAWLLGIRNTSESFYW